MHTLRLGGFPFRNKLVILLNDLKIVKTNFNKILIFWYAKNEIRCRGFFNVSGIRLQEKQQQ
jgi:hypothetical protein